jgi:hypothetical protein
MEDRTSAGLAKRILQARLDRLLTDAAASDRQLVADAIEVLTGGSRTGPDLPGWALVETDPDGSPTDRRIELD